MNLPTAIAIVEGVTLDLVRVVLRHGSVLLECQLRDDEEYRRHAKEDLEAMEAWGRAVTEDQRRWELEDDHSGPRPRPSSPPPQAADLFADLALCVGDGGGRPCRFIRSALGGTGTERAAAWEFELTAAPRTLTITVTVDGLVRWTGAP